MQRDNAHYPARPWSRESNDLHAKEEVRDLAPEMAEAILAWRERMEEDFDEPLDVWHPNVRECWDLADKLRAIGATDATEPRRCSTCPEGLAMDNDDLCGRCRIEVERDDRV